MAEEYYPGRRLSFSGSLCTIRYIGSVSGTKGEWLGVEWDDGSRGKHNGSHEGVKYFDCQSQHPTAGSFIRPSRPHDRPLSFLEALSEKYASAPEHDSLDETGNEKIIISGKVVEEIGFEQIRTQLAALHALRIVLLDGRCIGGVVVARAPPPSGGIGVRELWLQERARIEAQRLAIVELDLSRNLVEEWAQVVGICGALRSLRILNVSGNRFRDISLTTFNLNEQQQQQQLFLNVQELNLDATLLSWEAIVDLTSAFPSLINLSANSNCLATLTTPLHTPTLKTLSLRSNLLPALSCLSPLTLLPNLTTLSLRSNPLTTLNSPGLHFPTLSSLDLIQTHLTTLETLSSVPQTFPSLTSLLISKTPLATLPSASLLTIARLPILTTLNFSRITPAERQNAELHYLARIVRQLEANLYSDEETDAGARRVLGDEYPRYAALCEKYGEPTIAKRASAAAEAESEAGTLEARLVLFTFYMRNSNSGDPNKVPTIPTTSKTTTIDPNQQKQREHEEEQEQKILIPFTVNIYRLKAIVGRAFGIKPMHCKLIWETGEWDPMAGTDDDGDDDGEWSCDGSEEEEEEEGDEGLKEGKKGKGRWVRREVEFTDGMRKVGGWVEGEGKEVRVRVERR